MSTLTKPLLLGLMIRLVAVKNPAELMNLPLTWIPVRLANSAFT
jgi:hypothetical protein